MDLGRGIGEHPLVSVEEFRGRTGCGHGIGVGLAEDAEQGEWGVLGPDCHFIRPISEVV